MDRQRQTDGAPPGKSVNHDRQLRVRLLVKVKHPEIEHTARVQDFERWLEASPRSPAERILKNRLRELLG
jgi:hypothetical protein